MKRIFDIFCAILGLLLISPVFIIVALLVKMQDGGPVFYLGERVGRNRQIFRIIKFRTMVVDAELKGGSSTSNRDPRLTKCGKYLRKYKLDEVPQLINVLKGEMSIVGPRPEVKNYTDMFSDEEMAILSIRPGITDWASIWNVDEGAVLAGAADPELAYLELVRPMKLKLQLKYVRERSFWVDLKIIFLTLVAIFQPESQNIQEK